MEIGKRVKSVLKSSRGSSIAGIAFVAIFLLVIVSLGYESIRLQIIAQGTRDGMETVITDACTANYSNLYDGLREGYSGGYKIDGGSWSEDIDTADAYAFLDRHFGTRPNEESHEKYIGSNLEFSITDLSIQMTNTPFAPASSGSKKFTGTATYTVVVPLSFGWQSLPPLTVPMKVQAGYTQKF